MALLRLRTVLAAFVALQLSLLVNSLPKEEQAQCTIENHRPRYHFSPAEHWINDPNGMVYYDGVYHLFYQYHPFSTVWGPMHWGHATSRDLVTWEEIGIALEPDNLGQIFSGSAVVDTTNTTGFKTDPQVDPIVAIYTSASGEDYLIQKQSIAYSNDKGITFTKYENNPVLEDSKSPNFRDPKVFYHGDKWIMSLAVGNRIEFYGSPDLKTWEKLSEFGAGVGNHDGVWECPDLIPLNVDINEKSMIELWVLLVSINPGGPNKGSATQYFVGEFNGTVFQAYEWENTQWLDWGPDNYAGVTFSNEPNGRALVVSWMNNWDYANEVPTAKWRGQMTIPRTLGLYNLDEAAKKYRLTSTPAEETRTFRDPLQYLENNAEFPVPPQNIIWLTESAAFTSPTMELEIRLEVTGEPQFSICAYNSVDEEVCFGYNDTKYYLDRSKSGNTTFSTKFNETLVATAAREVKNAVIPIRIFLDTSSIEVFADDGLVSMTALFFPSQPLDKFSVNHWSSDNTTGTVSVKSYKVWGLKCSVPDSLVTTTESTITSSTTDTTSESTTTPSSEGSGSSQITAFNILIAFFVILICI